jgi:hypothetical protein
MNSTELKTHLQTIMRGDIAEHLRTVHGIAEPPKTKQAQAKLHAAQDHTDTPADKPAAKPAAKPAQGKPAAPARRRPATTVKPAAAKPAAKPQPAQDARSQADASVLAGVTRKQGEPAAANQPRPKPPARRKVQDAPLKPTTRSKPAAAKPTTRKPASKPAAKSEPVAAASNGTSPREHNQELARRLADLVAKEFADSSTDDQIKVANWLHALPTGGAGWQRYWPQGFARPTSAGWRVPEGESLPQ